MNIDFSLLNTHMDLSDPGSSRVATIRQDAKQLILSVIRRENLQVSKVIPLEAGMWSAVFWLSPLNIVLKFPNDVYEIDFLQCANTHGIPVPRLISDGYVEEHNPDPIYYVLMDYVPQTCNSEKIFYEGRLSHKQLLTLADDIGHVLYKLHQVKLGFIGNRDVRFSQWGELLRSRFKINPDNLVPTALFERELLTTFKRILQQSSYMRYTDGRLMHGDLHLGNTLVDMESFRLQAIIDPWDYMAGMPMYDLAYASLPWEYGMDYHTRVLTRYRALTDTFYSEYYFISLLIVAYWENRQLEMRNEIKRIREIIFDYVIPHIGAYPHL